MVSAVSHSLVVNCMSFGLIFGISVQHLQAGASQHATTQGLYIRLLQRPQPQKVTPLLVLVCNACKRE